MLNHEEKIMWEPKKVTGLPSKKELERLEKWRQINMCPNCDKGVLWVGWSYHSIGQNVQVFCKKCDFAVDLTEYETW